MEFPALNGRLGLFPHRLPSGFRCELEKHVGSALIGCLPIFAKCYDGFANFVSRSRVYFPASLEAPSSANFGKPSRNISEASEVT